MTVLALAVGLDLLVGDPPNRWHPVAWIGALISRGRRLAPRAPDDLALFGTFLILVVAGVTAARALAAHAVLARLPAPVALLGDAWLLKCSFSLDGLFAAVEIVRGPLVAGDLAGARRQVAWHLVSRPTDDLDAPEVASAAVESLAENLTDGLLAPVCFYVVGTLLGGAGAGLALAWAYRAVNTADAMIGYRRTSSSIWAAPPPAPTTRSTTCRPGWPPRRSWPARGSRASRGPARPACGGGTGR